MLMSRSETPERCPTLSPTGPTAKTLAFESLNRRSVVGKGAFSMGGISSLILSRACVMAKLTIGMSLSASLLTISIILLINSVTASARKSTWSTSLADFTAKWPISTLSSLKSPILPSAASKVGALMLVLRGAVKDARSVSLTVI